MTDRDGLHGTTPNAVCRECGCVSGIIGQDYVIRHAMACTQTAGYRQMGKKKQMNDGGEMSMREKMARAIFACSDVSAIGHTWESISGAYRQSVFEEVDAALDALMEPTDGMKDATHLPHMDDIQGKAYLRGPAAYEVMIHAAKEGK